MFITKLRTVAMVVFSVLAVGLVTMTAFRQSLAQSEAASAQAGPGAKKGAPAAQAGDAEKALKKALVDEARKVYEMDTVRLKNAQGVAAEELYRWSRRLLEAQLDLAANRAERITALKEHLGRMQEVEQYTKALVQSGRGRAAEARAGRYYRTQAELWLAREPKK